MATFETTARFDKDWADLDPADRARFRKAVGNFIADLEAATFRPGLRIKRVQGTDGIFEMTFAPDGRATWQYGTELQPGRPHIIWRRIGTHDILTRPPGPYAAAASDPGSPKIVAAGAETRHILDTRGGHIVRKQRPKSSSGALICELSRRAPDGWSCARFRSELLRAQGNASVAAHARSAADRALFLSASHLRLVPISGYVSG